MIHKKTAKQHGIKITDTTKNLTEEKNKKLNQLKKIIPNLVNSDNQININALNDFINIANTTSNNKGYELTFAGKGIARAMADSETNLELKVQKKQSKNFDSTENVLIRGDNLEVLKILKQNYFEKIKMIYIDPPYNTKSENFIYKDNFKKNESELIDNFGLDENTTNFLENIYGTRSHSGWLSFMYPRLKLARDLLKEDGVIFISIDDNEQANLKIMCDEIFGEENFVGELIIKNNPGGRDYGGIAITHEYIFAYSKQDDTELNLVFDKEKKFSFKDEKGEFDIRELRNRNTKFNNSNRPNLFYPFYVNKNNIDDNGLYEISLEKKENFIKVIPLKSQGIQTVWRWGKDKVLKNLNIDVKAKLKNDNTFMIIEKYRSPYKRERSIWDETSVRNEAGSLSVKKLFNKKIFDYPKSIETLKRIILLGTCKSDLILDFFAGSGTTGDAVMQLNAEDGGTRKFILVQWDEEIKKETEAYQFCTKNEFAPVISSITIERLNRAGQKIKNDFEKNKDGNLLESKKQICDIGYKVFSLTAKPKLIEKKQDDKKSETEKQEEILFEMINERKETINTLVNMLCATGKTLDSKIEQKIKDKLYKIEKEFYLLGEIESKEILQQLEKELVKEKDNKIYLDGYSNISLENWLNLEVASKENIEVVY